MPVTVRPMTDDDLSMLHDWMQREHVVARWGGESERCRTLAETSAEYAPAVMAAARVTPWIAELDGVPIGFAQSYVVLGSGGGWWEGETDPGARGIDQFLADGSRLGQGLGTQLVRALVARLFADPEVTTVQTDPAPDNARAIRCYEKAGFRRAGLVDTPDGPALLMLQPRAPAAG